MTNTLMTIESKLTRSMAADSLDDFVKSRTQRSLLLVDFSISMARHTARRQRKIDALRTVVAQLLEERPLPVAGFGRWVGLIEADIPEPQGGTPMAEAIDFGAAQGANHLIVVTDGEPDNADTAYAAAARFGGPIDVFYIAGGGALGASFAEQLAHRTGGTYSAVDLGAPAKQLAGGVRKLLTSGLDTL